MADEASLTDVERDVITLAGIAHPLTLDVIASVLDLADSEASDIVDRLAGIGAIEVDRRGITGLGDSSQSARRSMLAGRLLSALDDRGVSAALTGAAAWAAGDSARAYADYSAVASAGAAGVGELDRVVEAGRESQALATEIASLLLMRGRAHRNRGESDAAMSDVEAAMPDLGGAELVDALGFAGAVQDDLQRPADAERHVAIAMLVAAEAGLLDKLGSLATFHGRMLARVGFAREADDSFERGLALVEEYGTDVQHFYASTNQAWTAFDRGWMAHAEHAYAAALTHAAQIESEVSAADKEIALARARFGSGEPALALEGLRRAREVAARTEAPVLEFLATIAEVEGALLYERPREARDAVERLADIVHHSFPAWENRLATLEARVALQSGDRAAARRAVAVGRETTPYGANGARLRAELDALDMAAAEDWRSTPAAELNDHIIQSGWLGLAAWFMTVRSQRDGDPEVGMVAAGLAHRLGNPMLAARAVTVAEQWTDARADVIAHAVERVARRLPEGWRSDFMGLSFVAPAMYRAGQVERSDDGALIAGLDAALSAAGLSGLEVLSPAQRRAAGLVAAPSRVRSAFAWLAPLVGAAAIAAIVAVSVAPDPPVANDPISPATSIVATTQPPVEERQIEAGDLLGQGPFAGGEARNATYPVQLGEPTGFFWRRAVTGFISHDPVLEGKNLYVGTSEGFFSSIDIANSGSVVFEDPRSDSISSSASVGQVSYEQDGASRKLVFYGDDTGILYARNVDDARGAAWPPVDLGSPITGPPLISTEYVIVATADGVIFKLRGSDGSELGRFPTEGEVEGGFDHPLARSDGLIYAVTGDGVVKLIEEETLVERCEVASVAGAAVTNVMVAEGSWFFGNASSAVSAYDTGTCASSVVPNFQIDVPVVATPPIADGVMWAPADGLLLPLNVSDGDFAFTSVDLEGTITSPPIIAGGYVLVGVSGVADSELVAVSRIDGTVAWRYRLAQPLRTRPVVGDGVIVVATDRELIAIAAPAG